MKEVIDKFVNTAFSLVQESFFAIKGLIASYFLSSLIILYVHSEIKNDFNYEWIVYGFLFFIIAIYWLIWRYRLPRNDDKRTGIVIAMHGKDLEALRLKKKFINELNRNIHDASLSDVFNVVPLKNHQAEKVHGRNEIEKINKKIKGHFYLYGDIQKERDGNEYRYFIKLEGYIAHKIIPIPVSQELSVDFRNVLPKEIDFSELFGYRCIRATGKIAYLAAKYVVGVAALLSENPFLAFRLHKDLENEFGVYDQIESEMSGIGEIHKLDRKYLNHLREKLRKMISNESLILARVYQIKNNIPESKKCLDIAERSNPRNYGVHLLKGIFAFLYEQDANLALACIKKAKQLAGNAQEWRYSLAFLYFWQGDFDAAYRESQKIIKNAYENESITVNEIEDFNLKILESRRDKPQLYFWIAYIVLKKRGDAVLARKYFESFLTACNGTMPFLEEKARSFLTSLSQ